MNLKSSAVWLLVSAFLVCSLATDTFLDRLRNSEHVSTSERSFTAHAKRVSIGTVTEKAKYEHRRDVIKLQRSQPDVMHSVVFSIQQRNIDRLEDILLDVSDPQSINYGKHLTYEEVQELTANPQGTQLLLDFLESEKSKHNLDYKVTKQSLNGEYITVEAPLKLWENLFQAEFHEFSCVDVPEVRFHRALQYNIPGELNKHISSVLNTVQMPDLNCAALKRIRASKRQPLPSSFYNNAGSMSTTSANNTSLDTNTNSISPLGRGEILSYVTPALLNRIYSIDSNNGNQLGSQAVYETIGQTFSPTDLTIFQELFGLPIEAVSHVIGGHSNDDACVADNGNNCIEANLDVQYLMAVANNVPTTYYYWAGDDFLLDWIQQVANMINPPLVFSISYGVDETELPASYGREFDIIAMKLGVRGVTILASSGDDGAVSPTAGSDSMRCGYNPSFPATSPYVTAVGGTMGPENHQPEVVCQSDKGGIITSGGGFSTIYSTPQWQRNQIQSYMETIGSGSTGTGGLPGKGAPHPGFNTGGRGYPDVSALAFNYVVAINKNFTLVSGTSASSPVLAGMISLVNAARIAEGKSPLGWINPVLYQLYETFAIDITEGTNNCAATAHVCCAQGYSAMAGWDPVTGLGSVNFSAFKQALLALGDHPLTPTAAPTVIPGSPTVIPTIATTASPSVAPTAYPAIHKGWMYLTEYSNMDCEGDITSVSGVPVGVCLIQYNPSTHKAVGSIQYNCNDVQATVSSYSGTTCQESKLQQRQYFGTGCAYSVQDSYALDPSTAYSTSLQCSARSTVNNVDVLKPPVPVTNVVRDYIMQSTFDSFHTCDEALLSGYSIYLQNHCFDVLDDDYGDYSYKFVYPEVYVYSSLECKGRPQRESLSATCSAMDNRRRLSGVSSETSGYADSRESRDTKGTSKLDSVTLLADDDQANDAFFEIWSNIQSVVATSAIPTTIPTTSPTNPTATPTFTPTIAPSIVPTYTPTIKDSPTMIPTIQPTVVPSMLPTVKLTVAPSAASVVGPTVEAIVTISVDQALQGIDAASFKSGGFHAEYVFQVAVSMSIDNIHPSDVIIVKTSDDVIIVDSSTSKAMHISAQYINVCVVSYTIKINTATAGYATADIAYTTIVDSLTSAIETKQFDKFLNDGARSFNVPALYNVVSPNTPDAISTSFTATPTNQDTNNNNISSSVIIATILIVLVCLFVVSLVCTSKFNLHGWLRGRDARYNTLDTESLHGSVHSSGSNTSDNNSTSASGSNGAGASEQKMSASTLLGRTLMRATARSSPTAPPAPRFTIETEDEESGNVDPREKDQGIELTTRGDTYNPIASNQQAGNVQESVSV